MFFSSLDFVMYDYQEEDSGLILGVGMQEMVAYELEKSTSEADQELDKSTQASMSEPESSDKTNQNNESKNIVTDDAQGEPIPISVNKEQNPDTLNKGKEKVNPIFLYKSNDNQNAKKENSEDDDDGDDTSSSQRVNITEGEENSISSSNNSDANGTGFGGIEHTLPNRKFLYMPQLGYDSEASGKIFVNIKVDQNGKVIFAKTDPRKSTIINSKLWTICERTLYGSKLNASQSFQEVQSGVIIFKFRIF